MEEEAWRSLVQDGFSQCHVEMFHEKSLQWIDDLAGGLPFYVQMAAAMLWQYGDRTQAQSEFIFQATHRFRELWDDLTAQECQILKSAANGVSGEVQSNSVANTLQRHGLLRSDGRLFSSAFAEFVREQHV